MSEENEIDLLIDDIEQRYTTGKLEAKEACRLVCSIFTLVEKLIKEDNMDNTELLLICRETRGRIERLMSIGIQEDNEEPEAFRYC